MKSKFAKQLNGVSFLVGFSRWIEGGPSELNITSPLMLGGNWEEGGDGHS